MSSSESTLDTTGLKFFFLPLSTSFSKEVNKNKIVLLGYHGFRNKTRFTLDVPIPK